jgi:hypothetical protein
VISGGKAMVFDTKILHDGGSGVNKGIRDGDSAGPSAATATLYDEIYTSSPGADVWNATGVSRLICRLH